MRITVELEERDRRALNALSQSLGVSSDLLAREAIREFLLRNGQARSVSAPSKVKMDPDTSKPLNG